MFIDTHDNPCLGYNQPINEFNKPATTCHNSLMNNIEAAISELRKAAGNHPDIQGNETELARLSGVPQSTVTRIFDGGSEPKLSNFLKLAKACEMPVSLLLGEKPKQRSVDHGILTRIIADLENSQHRPEDALTRAKIIAWTYLAELEEKPYELNNVIDLFKFARD